MKRKGNVLGITSPKGGVGKTVTTANLAVVMSMLFDKKVLAVDTNITTASLGFHFDIIYPEVTIYDVMKRNFSIKDAIYKFNDNLDIIPASIVIEKKDKNIKTMQKSIKHVTAHFDLLLSQIAKRYDLILLDAAGGFGVEALATMEASDGILLVTNPEYPAILATAKLVEYAKLLKVPMGGIMLTKVRGKTYELSKEEIEESLKVKVIGEVPMDNNIPKAIAKKVPVTVYKPYCKSSVIYKQVAASILGKEYEPNLRERFRNLLRI